MQSLNVQTTKNTYARPNHLVVSAMSGSGWESLRKSASSSSRNPVTNMLAITVNIQRGVIGEGFFRDGASHCSAGRIERLYKVGL